MPTSVTTETTPAGTERDSETLGILLEAADAATQRQLALVQVLDRRLFGIFAVASVVIGLVGAGAIQLRSAPLGVVVLLAVGAAAWGLAAAFSIQGLRTGSQRVTGAPDRVWTHDASNPPAKARDALLRDRAGAYDETRPVIAEKSRLAGQAFSAATVEVGVLAAATVVAAAL